MGGSYEDHARNKLQFFVDPLPASKLKTPFLISGKLLTSFPRFSVRVRLLIRTLDETADYVAMKQQGSMPADSEKLCVIANGASLPIQAPTNVGQVPGVLTLGAESEEGFFEAELRLFSAKNEAIIVDAGVELFRAVHITGNGPNENREIRRAVAAVLIVSKISDARLTF